MGDLVAMRDKAIDIGKQACQYDKEGKFDEALRKYIEALEYFQHLMKCTSLFPLS